MGINWCWASSSFYWSCSRCCMVHVCMRMCVYVFMQIWLWPCSDFWCVSLACRNSARNTLMLTSSRSMWMKTKYVTNSSLWKVNMTVPLLSNTYILTPGISFSVSVLKVQEFSCAPLTKYATYQPQHIYLLLWASQLYPIYVIVKCPVKWHPQWRADIPLIPPLVWSVEVGNVFVSIVLSFCASTMVCDMQLS